MAVFSGNGSATSPSFTFSSDNNLGIYRVDADKLGIATNGQNRVTINNTGLGINTDPSTRFHVTNGVGLAGRQEVARLDAGHFSGAAFAAGFRFYGNTALNSNRHQFFESAGATLTIGTQESSSGNTANSGDLNLYHTNQRFYTADGVSLKARIGSSGIIDVGHTLGLGKISIDPDVGQPGLAIRSTDTSPTSTTEVILSSFTGNNTYLVIGVRGSTGSRIFLAHRGSSSVTTIASSGTFGGSLAWNGNDLEGTAPGAGSVTWHVMLFV